MENKMEKRVKPDELTRRLRSLTRSFPRFASEAGGVKLYRYQARPAEAILESVRLNQGLTFVLVLPRQSGKDELLCHLKAYLMRLLSYKDRGIVEVNPTYKPQTIAAIMRLENRMQSNFLTMNRWKKRSDYIRYIGRCRTTFLSGDGSASVVGATADLLLIVNEAQDILPATYDKRFAPMAASRNATRLLCGTVWTSGTLLSRELRSARRLEETDGIRRAFFFTADDISRENKSYAKYVQGEIARLGRDHPFVRTQYFCEEIDAQAGMFNPGRMALMTGDGPAQEAPVPGGAYAFLLDVAGQDEARLDPNSGIITGSGEADLVNAGRDSTALSIASIDLSSLATLQAPTYRIVKRLSWTGVNHLTVFGQVKAYADTWKPQYIVVDATGVGEGLWAMLDKAFPTRVIPVKFTRQVKSEIGWKFLAIIETGRFRICGEQASSEHWTGEHQANTVHPDTIIGRDHPCLPGDGQTPSDDTVSQQYEACLSEILPGPGKTLRWGVPEGTRGPDGGLIHDDYVLADSLVAVLDQLDWHFSGSSIQIDGDDPLQRERRF